MATVSVEQALPIPVDITSTFPASYFMDRGLFDDSRQHIPAKSPDTSKGILDFISEYVGDFHALTMDFYQRVHWWLPILSKTRMSQDMLVRSPVLKGDFAVLLLSMKLLLWNPSKQLQASEAKSEAYVVAKHAIIDAVNGGALTLSLLQAQVFVALYELGHAIYPAAHLSIGTCARYGIALGVDKAIRLDASDLPYEGLEIEERRRLWWVILILDRYMQLGNTDQPLSTPDPNPSSLLPSDDQAFDQGNIPVSHFSVSDAASVKMGMLARMAQAAYLLGHVHCHLNHSHSDESSRQEELWQLDRTLHALLNLSYEEGAIRRMPVCVQTSICYSSLILLHDPKPLLVENHMALDLLKPVTASMLEDSKIFMRGNIVSVEDASPMLLFWAYQAASIYNRLVGRFDSDALLPLLQMKEKLIIMSRRWKAGDVYLHMLETKEANRSSIDMIY
ncbi:hypothetical protein EJ08DRAFT_408390 [Tothia fuscella]|uniref:Xylanolytic transcriptional activator regulatory domain-containing protein n=1 Tax=Tothia fuscella TaxID=1048955 RepID=A0A9P4TVS6_9PEZI|nr:hypothetical protein EJ08DRAFT_408390 [Tothia fuscella]